MYLACNFVQFITEKICQSQRGSNRERAKKKERTMTIIRQHERTISRNKLIFNARLMRARSFCLFHWLDDFPVVTENGTSSPFVHTKSQQWKIQSALFSVRRHFWMVYVLSFLAPNEPKREWKPVKTEFQFLWISVNARYVRLAPKTNNIQGISLNFIFVKVSNF